MATSSQLQKDSKILIIGAGVFGLSATLHLLQRGYTNLHLFDRQPFDKNQYDETKGAHGASCDLNKIVRASYGGAKLYQDLAFKAMPEWEKWNAHLAATPKAELPCSLDPSIPLWHNCGFLRLSSNGLEPSEVETQQNFPSEIKHTQYRISDPKRREDAVKEGIPLAKLDPFDRADKGLSVDGVLDTTAGFVLASRACAWALHLALRSGRVTTYFGPDNALQSFMKTGNRISGIVTSGYERHSADFVLVAAGGWTPSLIPGVDRLLETTSGSVLSVRLPEYRQDLWDKYSEEKFPVWSWNMGSYVPHRQNDNIAGLYGLPRTPEGIVKVAFRGAKWTSYTRRSSVGDQVSYPKTDADKVPEEAMRVMRDWTRSVESRHLPAIKQMGFKTCLVIGGTGGLGRAIAEHLAIRNHTVIIVGRNTTIGAEIVNRINAAAGRASFLPCDLSSAASIKELHGEIRATYSRIDVAINAAGIALGPAAKLADVDLSAFKTVMDINVTAVFLCMQEQLRMMLDQKDTHPRHIINLASIYSSSGAPFATAYCTSKHAIVGLTKTAALEYAAQGIAINAVAPGAVPTAMTNTQLDLAGKLGDRDFGKIGGEMVKQYPMNRYGSPEEVAKAVAYLVDSSWVTGTVLTVDGGWSAGTSMSHALL